MFGILSLSLLKLPLLKKLVWVKYVFGLLCFKFSVINIDDPKVLLLLWASLDLFQQAASSMSFLSAFDLLSPRTSILHTCVFSSFL